MNSRKILPDNVTLSVSDTLALAAEKSGKYEWAAAADLYKAGLEGIDPAANPLEAARITMQVARSWYNAAFQAQDRAGFKEKMRLAEANYSKAASLYDRVGSDTFSKLIKAKSLCAVFWVRDEPDDKRNIISQCIEQAKEAAKEFENRGERIRLAEANHDLLTYCKEALNLARDRKLLLEFFEGALNNGRRAVAEFEALSDDEALLDSLHSLVFLYLEADHVVEPSRYTELLKETEQLRGKIAQVSERIGTPLASILGGELDAFITGDLDGNMPSAMEQCETLAKKAEAIKDFYLTGRLLTGASSFAKWAAGSEEYSERRRELLEKAHDFASQALNHLEVSRQGAWLKVAYLRAAEVSSNLALIVETDTEKKRLHVQDAIDIARKGMVYENHAWKAGGIGHELSKALYFLATMEADQGQKVDLLREALAVREETVRTHGLLSPHSWSMGVMLNYLALIKAELSQVEEDPGLQTRLLQDAVEHMQQCVYHCSKWAAIPALVRALARYEEWYGDILLQLYRVTQDPSVSKRSKGAYESAIQQFTKSENLGPIASIKWKIAQVLDLLGDHEEASNSFKQAAEEYRQSTKRLPGLASAFEDLASYMAAWALIEEARLLHNREQYSLAADNYSKASDLIQTTKTWAHTSKHYAACSLLEQAETLSRQEKHEPAIESFTSAAEDFKETTTELEAKLRKASSPQDKRELLDWVKITERRQKYCLARTDLERARVLDRIGEEEASGAKYRSASEAFKAMLSDARNEQGRRELETLSLFCEAWAKMKEAEARASPELYKGATASFLEAEKAAETKRFRFLALANASICKALETGTTFRRTRDTRLYSEIKRYLETAADYYQEAGFENASQWTRATQRLFDALAYLADAEVERETEKRAELYLLAERHLELAARLYDQAGFARKRDEALKNLKRAKEEKELLLTPTEVLSGNPAITQVTVAPVSLLRDKAAGLERFEEASVVGNLKVSQTELHVGSDLAVDIEIGNIGKTTATLVKLVNVAVPGLQPDIHKTGFRIDENRIDLKGKRLDYLKTHQVRIALKATRKGSFQLRPEVLFVDEKGNHGSYEFEPTVLVVRELGIAGWIKGPGRS